MKKSILIIIVIAFLAVFFVVFMQKSKQTERAVATCVSGLVVENLDRDFATEEIVIKFKEEIDTVEKMKDIVEKYDGPVVQDRIGNLGAALVKVPVNSEFEWICRLQNEDEVEFGQLNYLMELH